MLKSFDELIQVDVKPFCDLRDAKDEKGNVIKVPYLSWAKCAKLLHENGASSVWYAPRRCPETNTYLWPQAKITTSKGRTTECWFVSVEIHIDDLEFSYDMPLLNGSLVVVPVPAGKELLAAAVSCVSACTKTTPLRTC